MPGYLAWLCASVARERLRNPGKAVAIASRVSAEAALLSVVSGVLRLPFLTMVVTGDRGGSEFSLQRRRWVREGVRRRAFAVVTHTRALAEELERIGLAGRVEVIPALATPTSGEPCPYVVTHDRPTLAWCGRDDPVKNLEALGRIYEGQFRAHGWDLLLIVDRRPSVIDSAGARVHVQCPSPRTHFDGVEVFVMTSYYEGQSNAIVEAALEGVPAVAFATGGTEETIGNLAGGTTLPLGADDKRFADAVSEVAERFSAPDARSALRARATHIHVHEAAERWDYVIEAAAIGRLEPVLAHMGAP
ncbi:MAG: glycosyltransferase [Actinomycetota bacterium]|nr:glycosyltransferase [Actinomycetota bacterium]